MNARKTTVDLPSMPGHAARRVQQLSVALYLEEVAELNLTPVQYSSLQTIRDKPGLDQKTLAKVIAYDTSTIGGVIDRLEARGLVRRTVSPADGRVRLLTITSKGGELLQAVIPRMLNAQKRILAPLNAHEQKEFMRLQQRLIAAHSELSTVSFKD